MPTDAVTPSPPAAAASPARARAALDALAALLARSPAADRAAGEHLLEGLRRDVQDLLDQWVPDATRYPAENPFPVLRLDPAGVVLYANRASAPLLARWKTSVGDRVPDGWAQEVRAALASGAIRRHEVAGQGTMYELALVPVDGEYVNVYALDVTARHEAVQALRQSEERFRIALQSGVITVAHVDRDLRYTWLHNPPPGLYPAGWEGRRDDEVLAGCDAGDVARLMALKREVLESGLGVRRELPLRGPAGARVFDVIAEPLRDERGRVAGVITALVDISERRAAQRLLERSLRDLGALYEASQALLGEVDEEQILERVCQLAVGRFGRRMAWIGLGRPGSGDLTAMAMAGEGQEFARAVTAHQRNASQACPPLRKALDQRQAATADDLCTDPAFQEPLRTLALSQGFRSMAAFPVTVDENTGGVLAVYAAEMGAFDEEDVRTLQSLANVAAAGLQKARLYRALAQHADALEREVGDRTAALRESVALFRAIFDGAASGIGLLDEDGRLFAWNPSLEAMLAAPPDSLQDRPFREIVENPAERERWTAAYRAIMLPTSGPQRLEMAYRRGDGQVRWAQLVLSIIRDAQGGPRFGLVVADDVTEMRQAQQALIHAEKLSATGKLAASLIHEVKNPLQTVIGCLGLAREITRDDDVSRYLDAAHQELLRANELLSRLRDLNQRTAPEDRAPTDINTLVRRLLTLTERQARDQGVTLRADLSEEVPPLRLAADAMQQVFLNLTLNALEAMPTGGSLRICTEVSAEREVRVAFADTGPGVAPEDVERIFQGFFSTKSHGLGLGLFLCQSIVQQHGGRIALESAPGAGATFTVCLPVESPF